MLKRLGVIVWWCGAAVIAFSLLACAEDLQKLTGCDQAQQEYAHLNEEGNRRTAAAKAAHPDESDLQALLRAEPVAGIKEALEATEQCSLREKRKWDSLFYGILALPFFAVAFVLGGSFWRPPRLK